MKQIHKRRLRKKKTFAEMENCILCICVFVYEPKKSQPYYPFHTTAPHTTKKQSWGINPVFSNLQRWNQSCWDININVGWYPITDSLRGTQIHQNCKTKTDLIKSSYVITKPPTSSLNTMNFYKAFAFVILTMGTHAKSDNLRRAQEKYRPPEPIPIKDTNSEIKDPYFGMAAVPPPECQNERCGWSLTPWEEHEHTGWHLERNANTLRGMQTHQNHISQDHEFLEKKSHNPQVTGLK